MTLTRHQKGCYMDLLVAQFNSGPLSLETIKTVLGQDQAVWTVLSKKFKQGSDGSFYNGRLATEIEKRVNYTVKQKERVDKRWATEREKKYHGITTVLPTNIPIIENRNENGIKEGGAGETIKTAPKNTAQFPTPKDFGPLPEFEIGKARQLVQIVFRKDFTDAELNNQFNLFKLLSLTGKKFYETESEVFLHFQNWLKLQDLSKTTAQEQPAQKQSNDIAEQLRKTKERMAARGEAAA